MTSQPRTETRLVTTPDVDLQSLANHLLHRIRHWGKLPGDAPAAPATGPGATPPTP